MLIDVVLLKLQIVKQQNEIPTNLHVINFKIPKQVCVVDSQLTRPFLWTQHCTLEKQTQTPKASNEIMTFLTKS